jgi:hypothetical protein
MRTVSSASNDLPQTTQVVLPGNTVHSHSTTLEKRLPLEPSLPFADALHKGNFPVSPCTLRRRKFAKATSLSVKDENETSVVLTWQLPAN